MFILINYYRLDMVLALSTPHDLGLSFVTQVPGTLA